jgi:ubiquinone biosynthesis protein COQ9
MTKSTKLTDRILDKALELAAECSWEDVRLQQVSDALGIGLEDVRQYYRQKDDLAEALFDRADQAVLTASQSAEFRGLGGRDRMHKVIMIWLRTLAPHRRIVIDMFKYKLEPGHIHFQVLGVLRVSRTVQWILEACGSRTSHLSRIMEEVGTTCVYLTTLVYWLTDPSTESGKTNDFIDKLLRKSETLATWVNPDSIITKSAERLE